MERPYIILSSAMSCDGKISNVKRERIGLSNEADLKFVHFLRSQCDAILIGSTTLENDNPTLNVRFEEYNKMRIENGLPSNPIKVAISKLCIIDPTCNFLQKGSEEKYIFTTSLAKEENINKVLPFASVFQSEQERVSIPLLVKKLWSLGIKKLLIEGGGSTNFEFIKHGFVDELRIAVASMIFGGCSSPTLVDGVGFEQNEIPYFTLQSLEKMDNMAILHYKKEVK